MREMSCGARPRGDNRVKSTSPSDPNKRVFDARKLFESVRRRPGMYLVNCRYDSFVTFVIGCDCATECFEGFTDWLHQRNGGTGSTPYHWSAQLVHARFPERFNTQWTPTSEEDALLVTDLFETLDAFLSEHVSTFAILPASPPR
jgi:hypothetical protein